jgi:hypothetical protein
MNNFWQTALQYLIPIIITSVTGVFATLLTLFLNRKKNSADVKKTEAETEKTKAETDKIKFDKEIAASEEWHKLYNELKEEFDDFKKELDKKFKGIEIDNELLRDSLDIQEKMTSELEEDLKTEQEARRKLETRIESFRRWFIRNKKKLEEANIEPVPFEV